MSLPLKNTVFPMILLKVAEWFLYKLLANSCYKAAMKVKNSRIFFKNSSFRSSHQIPLYPNISKCNNIRKSETVICDIQSTLLRSESFFPYFMLIAFEGGSILRALFLLLSSPLLFVLDFEAKLRVMVFISFCGMKIKDVECVGRAVLPKFYLENLNVGVYEVMKSAGERMVFTSVPRVMVESFLKEYLSVDCVKGTELHCFGNYFSGFVSSSGILIKHRALMEAVGEKKPDIGIGNSSLHDHLFISLCKEAYVVNKEDEKAKSILPREKYPKPLVFHDGRLAFLPTPLATLAMFMWLPIGIPLSIFRILIGICLPYKVAVLLGKLSGIRLRVKGTDPPRSENDKGVLYVCTHRTLLDPVFLSTSLGKPLTAVTYSLSKMSEILAPIKTVRLTRSRQKDGEAMQRLLSEGDLVVCPEGTTCREPYLLRFSSLFAELADEIVPVAMNTNVSMFYGTTASGLKCLDPIFFLMNPRPCYNVEILGKLPKELTCAGGKSSHEVANYIQRQLGAALGFECTNLTRRDKYLMLAGNEGVVEDQNSRINTPN
ncbi:glycerol-3-phosphate acyltransferase 1 [Solanum tuberosum]|uniref:ER glycerol-phosphate acyltransferase n=2 Tax=Solanum TaxID=4107 RepID=M1BGE4_SOLTU|nr:PREDICTED: glycerol-3-phosphate acyltransferase 1 [Solanum tuberosum]